MSIQSLTAQPSPYSPAILDAAHLLRRAGFGGTPLEVQDAARNGLAATTKALFDFSDAASLSDDAIIDRISEAIPQTDKMALRDRLPVLVAQCWWVYRMVASPAPLQEKMTLFWHNHFTSRDGNGWPLVQQNQLYRRMALGNFRTLTLEVSKNPEMLSYLNNNQNYKAHPNENYARELMELFTCGRVGPDGVTPNYTENDVKAAARAFSGWNTRRKQFYYNPDQHDDTAKTFMGRTGDLNGDDVVDILVALPSTAYRVCNKLFRYFAYDDPEPAVMHALVQTYYRAGYEIQPIVEQILTSDAFYSLKARDAVMKSPAEVVIGAVRMLGLQPEFAPPVDALYGDDPIPSSPAAPAPPPMPTAMQPQMTMQDSAVQPMAVAAAPISVPRPTPARVRRRAGLSTPVGRLIFLANAMRDMGQTLFAPPTVKGWDGGAMWINTDTLQARARFGTAISNLPTAVIQNSDLWRQLQQATANNAAHPSLTAESAGSAPASEAAQILDTISRQLGPLVLPDATQQIVLQYAATEPGPVQQARGILALLMSAPQYQTS